jgi:hypothetical protein
MKYFFIILGQELGASDGCRVADPEANEASLARGQYLHLETY